MLGSPSRHRSSSCKRQPRNRDLQVCWANIAKNTSCHIMILHIAFTEKMDVICVQEPASYPGTKTQNHPGYDCYALVVLGFGARVAGRFLYTDHIHLFSERNV